MTSLLVGIGVKPPTMVETWRAHTVDLEYRISGVGEYTDHLGANWRLISVKVDIDEDPEKTEVVEMWRCIQTALAPGDSSVQCSACNTDKKHDEDDDEIGDRDYESVLTHALQEAGLHNDTGDDENA